MTLLVLKLIVGGKTFSEVMMVLFTVHQKGAEHFGYEPMNSDAFKRPFDSVLNTLLDAVGSKVGAVDRSSQMSEDLFLAAFAGVVLVIAVLSELITIPLTVGLALAGYHLFGTTFDVLSLHRLIVAAVVILTVTLLTYGNQRIRERAKYA